MKGNPGIILVELGITILIVSIISDPLLKFPEYLLDSLMASTTPNPNALVDGIRDISPPVEALVVRPGQTPLRFVTVNFQSGRSGLLDMKIPRSAVWADILDSLRQANQPAYVEIDPATNVITELLIPLTVRIGDLTPTATGDAVEVELIVSQARHYLRRTNPDFQQLLNTLRAAKEQGTAVLVTETDDHEIIDVRPLPTASPTEKASGFESVLAIEILSAIYLWRGRMPGLERSLTL